MRDIWAKLAPVIRTKRENKYIVIPAFSRRCGFPKHCLKVTGLAGTPPYFPFDCSPLAQEFTIEFWIKANVVEGNQSVFSITAGANMLFALFLDNRVANFWCSQGGVLFQLATVQRVPVGVWTHIAITYDGSTVLVYINGVPDSSTLALAQPLDITGGPTLTLAFGAAPLTITYNGLIDEFKVWDACKTQNQIIAKMQRSSSPDHNVNPELLVYFRFDEAAFNATILEIVSNTSIAVGSAVTDASYVTDEDGAPIKFGASFIAVKSDIILDGPSSLQFPVVSPASKDHSLYISWTDDAGKFQRRKLYDNGSDIWPHYPDYNGEVLSTTYSLEFWTIDGNDEMVLSDAMNINISKTTQPLHGLDHGKTLAATGTNNSALYAPFPWVFPVQFNQIQNYQ